MIIFSIAAVSGWNKLHYGFNFIDEGYHMTESWRLAAGDNFLKDKITGALMDYTLINSLIFKADPDITLLGFREIEYTLTLIALFIFSLALVSVANRYALLPFVFSLFAFTGLDPTGMISNLYYQTYPHLFLTLFLSFLLFGFHFKKPIVKNIFFAASGFCLWLISLSLLYLSVIIAVPFLIFFVLNKFNLKSYSFTLKELLIVISPFAICWSIFLFIYNKAYLSNLIDSLNVYLSMQTYSSGLINFNWNAIQYIGITFLFLVVFAFCLKKIKSRSFLLISCTILSLLFFFIIKTSCFGLLAAYYNGWFSKPMWFSSLLIAFSILFWGYIIIKYYITRELAEEEELSVILMLPFTISAFTMSTFSGLGLLSVSQSAIPAVAAILFVYITFMKNFKNNFIVNAIVLILLLSPFYYTTATFDWNFTYFDLAPKFEKAEIKTGFGKGIHTNQLYAQLYRWIEANGEKFTRKNDFAISYIVSPMVNMIIKRRPSLDDTFVTFEKPRSYYKEAVEKMEELNRDPAIAFVFERMPCLLPVSLEKGTYRWPAKQFNFATSTDPITRYVKRHMKEVSEFKISDDNIIRCFIDNKRYAEFAEREHKTGQKKNARELGPPIKQDSLQDLNRLAMRYVKEKKYDEAISVMAGPMLKLQPDNTVIYYNISCLYARKNKPKKAVEWLKQAIEKGYSDWEQIKSDPDLENIRNTAYYKKIVSAH